MAKNMYSTMTSYLISIIAIESSEILEEATYEKRDEQGQIIEVGVKYQAEVSTGDARKARYSIKLPNHKKLFTDEQLEEGIYAKFSDVTVSFIDTKKKDVYFKASKITTE